MATLALTIVGNALLPGVGGFVGAVAGSLLDNFIIIPALFPRDVLQGPRLTELPATSASEGTPMNWFLGPQNRVSGAVIWMSELIEVKSRTTIGKGGMGQKVDNYTYFVDIAISVGDATDSAVHKMRKVWGDAKVIYDNGATGAYEEITFYDGSQTTADPLIESYEGSGNAPAFVKTAYVVIKKLGIDDFGRRTPNLSFEMSRAFDVALQDAVASILERYGYTPDMYDVSRLPDCFKGMSMPGPQSGVDCLQPLMMAYSFSVQEDSDGKLVCIPKGTETTYTLSLPDFAAHESESEYQTRRFQLTDVKDEGLPTSMDVRYYSTDIDLQRGSEHYGRRTRRVEDGMTMDLPITLDPKEAKAIAKRQVWSIEGERQKVFFTLPPSYIGVKEADVLLFTYNGIQHRAFVTEINRGYNGLIEVTGYIQQPQTYTQSGTAASASTSGSSYAPPAIYSYLMDLPALQDNQITEVFAGLFYSACTIDPAASWRGVALLDSLPSGTNVEQSRIRGQAAMGKVINPPRHGPWHIRDTINTIRIKLYHGSVHSISEAELFEDNNRIAIQAPTGDWEIIGFRVVTSLGNGEYELSELLRGLRGTENLIDSHVSGAKCVVLSDDGSIGGYSDPASLGATKTYKVVPIEGSPANYASQRFQSKGNTLKPFAPINITTEVNGSGLVVSWTRRSKRFTGFMASGPLSLDESPERFEIEFVAGNVNGTVKRTVAVSGTTYTYSTSDMTTDGFIAGEWLAIKIYQMGNTGRGWPGSLEVQV